MVVPVGVFAEDRSQSSTVSGSLDRGEPDLSVHLPDDEVTPGTIDELAFEIRNDGTVITGSDSRVTDATAVTVELEDAGPFEAETDEIAIGPVQDGSVSEAPLPVSVPKDIEPGEYDVTVEVSYTHVWQVSSDGSVDRQSETETHDVTVEVPDEPRFDVTDVSTAVEPGASGDAEIEITNTGTEPATETRTTITAGGGVVVDGGTAEEVLGDLDPGESATAIVSAQISDDVSAGEKPLDLEFTYRDGNGVQQTAEPETASLAPAGEQSFAIEKLEADLSVGAAGTVEGDVRNEGPRTIDDAVLVVEPMSDSLFVEDTHYALPELKPGETAAFDYSTDVSGQADAGARQLQFHVEYTGGDETPLQDGPHSERVVVDGQVDEFSIDGVDTTVRQGETDDLLLEITNERSQTLSNIDAMLYTGSDLATDNDEAFVAELEPGESAEIPFDISAADTAAVETHPIELDFQYDTERGETVVSDTYQHPIDVVDGENDDGGGFGSIVGVLAVLALSGIGLVTWRQRG